jgi:hypothetical protein
MRIGVTGHRDLTEDTVRLVEAVLRTRLRELDDGRLVGVSCLASGADSLFAEVLIELGGRLEVVLPSVDYRAQVMPEHATTFERLLRKARNLHLLPHRTADDHAYVSANTILLGKIDHLVAVWDGMPAAGAGGTADVVHDATRRKIPVTRVWPPGSGRSGPAIETAA